MEDQTAGISQRNERIGADVPAISVEGSDGSIPPGTVTEVPEEIQRAEAELARTPRGIKKLRGKYFTVRHIPLTDCSHKMDVINQPRHMNCENCWWNFFRFHPTLCETVHEAWQEHGKEFVIRLRGKKFAIAFGRYMRTVEYFKEQERIEHENNAAGSGGAGPAGEEKEAGTPEALDQSTEVGSGPVGREEPQSGI